MTRKTVIILAAVIILCVFFTACSSGSSESAPGMEPVSGISGVYADLDSVSGTGCRLIIAGDPHFEIANVFLVYDITGAGEEVLLEPTPDFSQIHGTNISESGIAVNYNWGSLYGSLPRGQYRIMFTLLEGNASTSFFRDFTIH